MRRILCITAFVAMCACSVKENRSGCPCELLVKPSAPLETDGRVLISVMQGGNVVKQGMLDKDDFEKGKCRLLVPRGPASVTVFTGITSMNTLQGRRLDIRYENSCDEVYSSSEEAYLQTDTCVCSVDMHKNYANLYLTVLGRPEGATMSVYGTVRGYEVSDAVPYLGAFNSAPEPRGGNLYHTRLPRQLDDGLLLYVSYGKTVMRKVPIGKLIDTSGYRFDDENLMDISLTVDLDKSYAFIEVAPWREEQYTQIEF
ncbi:MAG: hypothetical protein IJU68_07070 [Bacteroidales bacterium]|nr:hypothetical protein [Bacteroidales bacterium]